MPPIPRSIRDLAAEFSVNRQYLSGWIDGRSMRTFRGPNNAICVGDDDYRLIRARFGPKTARRAKRG